MKKQFLKIMLVSSVMISILWSLGLSSSTYAPIALAAPGRAAPTVTAVAPNEAPNDLDITVMISGTGFEDTPSVYLGETALTDVLRISETELSAKVPWGMDPGVYALTVENPGGETDILVDAFTVTQGFGVWTSGGPYGGWVEYMALGDPPEDTIYAIVKNVGLFRSQDGGNWWERIFIEIGHENKVTVDPNNPDRLYIAKPGSEKAGLYQSDDRGDTWTALPKPVPDKSIAGFRAFVSPYNDSLYGALYSDLTDVSLGLFIFDETNQIWNRLEQPGLLDDTTPVTVVGFDPVDPQTLYAGLLDGTVIQSIDSGQTWSLHSLAPIDYIRELVVNPVGGELWICGPLSDGAQKPGGLYKYDGVSENWISMTTSPNVRNIIFDQNATNVDSQQVWIAADGVLKSENGGKDWTSLLSIQADAIALNPQQPQVIYVGSPEGVQKTIDDGVNWQPSNEGMTGVVPSFLAVNPDNPAIVYSCFVSTYGSQTGGDVWQKLFYGGGHIIVDPADSNHVISGLSIADNGWDFDREFTIPRPDDRDEAAYQMIITAISAQNNKWLMGVGYLDNSKPSFNYDGGGRIYESTDGENWTFVDPLLKCPPTGFGFDPVDENIMYAATSGYRGGVTCEGTFLRSTDSGQTWQESTTGMPFDVGGGYGGGVMAVEPTPPYRIFLGNYYSSDQGVTWQDVVNPLTVSNIIQMLFLPGTPSILYTATRAGLYRTMDGAQTWQQAQGALGQFEIWSLAGVATEDGRHIVYAATIGGVEEAEEFTGSGLRESSDALVNAGVYRMTTFSSLFTIFLPLIGQ